MSRFARTLLALPLAFHGVCCVAQVASLQIGPLRFGMTNEEARAAIPAEWQTDRKSEYTGRVFTITATGALRIGGLDYDVWIGNPYHSGQWLKLEREAPVAGAAECETLALSLATQLEEQVGRFEGPAPEMSRDASRPPINWTTQHLPNGGVIVTPMPGSAGIATAREELVKVGTNSSVTVGGLDDDGRSIRRKAVKKKDPRRYWVQAVAHSSNAEGPVDVELSADYRREAGRSCRLTLTAMQDPPDYVLDEIQFDPARVTGGPTIARRIHDLKGLEVPDGGVTIPVPCGVRASDGRLECPLSAPDGDVLATVAYRWAARYRLDPSGLDRDEPRLLPITIPVRIDPGLNRAPDFANAVVAPAGALRVRQQTYRTPMDFYPASALSRGITGTVDVACVTQEDGSLLCALAPDAPPPPEVLIAPAIAVVEQFEMEAVEPGQPVAGFLVRRRVAFQIEE